MQNRILTTVILVFILFASSTSIASNTNKPKIKTYPISDATAKIIIKNQTLKINLNDMRTNNLEPDSGQSFKVIINSRAFFIISTTRNSPQDYPPTCALLLFNDEMKFVSLVDTVGPGNDKRPWTCEGVEAISFSDLYLDGSLKIISLYLATAPSSERSIVPVVLRFDYHNLYLTIDDAITDKLENIDVDSIRKIRSFLNKLPTK
jgi:hypothetical protein